MKKTGVITIALALLLPAIAQSQDSLSNTYIDVGKIPLSKYIDKYVSTSYINKNELLETSYSSLHFTKGLIHKSYIPNNYVTKKVIVQFSLCNTADSVIHILFFPGYFYKDIQLYQLQNNKPEKLAPVLPNINDSIGYRYISVHAHDSITIIAELTFVKTYLNKVYLRLINPVYLDSFVSNLHNLDKIEDIVTYVFCGLLLMMMAFSIANFFQQAGPDFLYYSGYVLFVGGMLFSKAFFNMQATTVNFYIEGYLDFLMQGVGIIFYMLFMQKFLDTKKQHKFLYHLYTIGIVLLITSLLGYSYSYYFTDNFLIQNGIENVTKFLLLLMIVIFLIYSIRKWQYKLLRFIFWGSLCLLFFSLISQISIQPGFLLNTFPGIFRSSLFYYEMGLLLELTFFLLGLNYKTRSRLVEQTKERERLKAENQMKEYEKELAILKAQKEERERISADMHDELGSGMTAIRLMSEIAKNKMKENTPVEIEKISQSANDVLNKMNVIIWSMSSSNDALDNLISYIRAYALEYFENTPVICKIATPVTIASKELSGDQRRNIFLSVKEILNNALKHSKATEIKMDIEANHHLLIKITDNGVGIDMQHLRLFGNGLKNIAKRMESIGGSFKIENNNGTIVLLEFPL